MMTAQEVLQAYVSDVTRRLPRAKRSDVALELLSLLQEELQGKAEVQGRPADEAMALDLVRTFGAPEIVAERYRPASFVILPATGTSSFVTLAITGVALQWLVTLPVSLLSQPGHELVAIGKWWLTSGIGALWWPGFMVMTTIAVGWVRHKWPPPQTTTWRPRPGDRDDINRTGWAIAGIAAAAGIVAVVGAPWFAQNFLPPAAANIFQFDPDFVAIGGAAVVVMWSLTAVLDGIVFFEGRWRPLTRNLDLAMSALWLGMMSWLVFGPRIFTSPLTDEGAKGWMVIVLLIVVFDLAIKIYRRLQRPHTASAMAAITKA